VPHDSTPHASGASCKIDVPLAVIEDRVLQLGADAAGALPPWSAGVVP
jgi:hypothetical protein